MESLEKPVADRVLHAMAQAYPDRVDLSLLSMVMGCDMASLQRAVSELVTAGLAHARIVDGPNGGPRVEAAYISDQGMALACGLAHTNHETQAAVDRLEAGTLRQLLACRINASRLPAWQADELREALDRVSDQALIDAAKMWARQTVSDWRALLRALDDPPAAARREAAALSPRPQ